MSETNRCDGPSRGPVYYEDEPSEPLGAQCKNAASDASKLATQTDDDAKLRDYLRTKAIDPPLQDDVIGNMIPGALVGGVAAGIGAGASSSSLGAMAKAAATHAAQHMAKDAAKHAAVHSLTHTADVRTLPPPAGPSKDSASVPVKEPNQSSEPEVVGRDRAPYAPGRAPLRIPEPAVVIRG